MSRAWLVPLHTTFGCSFLPIERIDVSSKGSLRLVLDTDVLVASLRSDRGASGRLLIGALDGVFAFLASLPLIIEYEAVLTRPEHLEASGLTAQQVNALLDALVKVSIPVHLRLL